MIYNILGMYCNHRRCSVHVLGIYRFSSTTPRNLVRGELVECPFLLFDIKIAIMQTERWNYAFIVIVTVL